MTHTNESYANADKRSRVDGPSTSLNFGMVEIDWQNHQVPTVFLIALDGKGKTLFRQKLKTGL